MVRAFLLTLSFFFLSSCGYHFGRGNLVYEYQTICVPYVEGDDRGQLTDCLIRAFSDEGSLAYKSCNADLILNVCLLEPLDENIGFIFAPKEEADDFKDIVVSNEARLGLEAKVTLVNRYGECLLGPFGVGAAIDYDFEPDLSNVDFHAFSLGQLEMHNLAQDAAFSGLYKLLAEKIVDYVVSSW